MEVRVPCPCGQAYTFEVEPVNGRMPCPVNCPACGTDGTALANEVIEQNLGVSASVTSAPAVSAPSPLAAAPPPPATAGGLRINRQAHAPAAAAPPPDSTTPDAPPPLSAPPAYTRSRGFQPEAPAKPEPKENIPMGLLGGVVAGGIAMTGWYYLTIATNMEFGIAAWFVGVMTGIGVRLLAHEGGQKLGYIAALCACLAILGGKFLVANKVGGQIDELFSGLAEMKYDQEMKVAKEAVAARSEAEITTWLENNDQGPANPERIQKFRTADQPKMQDFVNGRPSKAEFIKKITAEANKKLSEMGDAAGMKLGSRFEIFKSSVDFFTILWLLFGVGSAWRIATG